MIKLISITSILLCFSLSQCSKVKQNIDSKIIIDTTTEKIPKISSMDEKSMKEDLDLGKMMSLCNETFRVEMSYLESLNTTGSFPDETDKTPKCYIRCVLEKLDVVSTEGEIDTDQAAVIFAGMRNIDSSENVEEMVNTCSERRESCKCEKSYNFLKCLFTMDIEKNYKS